MAHAHLLAPSLIAGSIIHLSFPAAGSGSDQSTSHAAKGKGKGRAARGPGDESVVRELPVRLPDENQAWSDVDVVKRIARSGSGRNGKLVLADANYVLSVCDLPAYDRDEDEDDADELMGSGRVKDEEQDGDGCLLVRSQHSLAHAPKAGTTWTGLEAGASGVLSSLSSGLISYNTYDSAPARHRLLPSGLLAMRGVPASAHSDSASSAREVPSTLALAGKGLEVSLWDTERTLAAPAGVSGEDPVRARATKVAGQKRKLGNKKEMEEGEVWRARNMPNNHLDLPTPIHHTCITVLSPGAQPRLATGTLSGHVRVYDARQRKAVSEWRVAREGGMGAVEAGGHEHELFFSDRSSMLGALDLRTGKILYTYAAQTSTPLSLLPLPHSHTRDAQAAQPHPRAIGLATISSDATLRLCSTGGVPQQEKDNVRRGEIVRTVGGVGLGSVCWLGWAEGLGRGGQEDEEEGEGEGAEVDDGGDGGGDAESEDEDEDLFDQMGVVAPGEDGEEDSDDDSEGEVKGKGPATKGRRGPAKKARAV